MSALAESDYREFVRRKLQFVAPAGLAEVPPLNVTLYPHQRDLVAWALRRGRAALFADTGLGKTAMQLEWAKHVPAERVLILAPLAVAAQTVAEGRRMGIHHSEVVIWKDPVTAMQRTKALGLLHKTVRGNATMSRQGIPDYLITMRDPRDPVERVTHGDDYPVSLWQNVASPVWMDINPSDTLQYRSAREHDDERHIAPLQLEVIRRAVRLWTNPKDVVLSPFAGIGSEGYVALQEGRRFVGAELKASYYRQAVANLTSAENVGQSEMFGWSAAE